MSAAAATALISRWPITTLLPGWSYRNMWWVSHNEHGAFTARGIHGQAIYVDPAAEMVIARFASHPLAANVNLDPMSLPAYHAMAQALDARLKPGANPERVGLLEREGFN